MVQRSFEYLRFAGPIPFAHRGGAAEAVENSWSAFERAVSLGYRYMETDVRTTSDGVALAFHDRRLERLVHRPGLLARTSWAELGHAVLDDGRAIPRIADLLGAWPEVRWNIDIKTSSAVAPVVEAVARAGAVDRVLVTAFSDARTARARRRLGRGVATGAGRVAIARLLAAKRLPALARTIGPWPAAAQVPLARRGVPIVDDAFLRACHSVDVAVHVWTVDDEPMINQLLDLGVDGIMTDRPTVLKQVMVARGQWR